MEPLASAKSLFLNAVELPTPAQRQAYLDEKCDGDEALRREVDLTSQTGEAALAAVCSKLPNNLRKKRLIACDTSVTCCCRISHLIDL